MEQTLPSLAEFPSPASGSRGQTTFNGFWGKVLDQDEKRTSWIWEGFLAPGNVTLLTSQWKSGKTTLISILLSRLREGGQLLGLPLAKGKAVVVSEEGRRLWRKRHQKLNLENTYLLCRPFAGKPSPQQWDDLIDHIAGLYEQGVILAVIDTLTTFLPCLSEANAISVIKALLPLQRLTNLGMGVLLSHHPAKGVPLPGQAARGSGALSGFADIIVEKTWCTRVPDPTDRRRKLLAFSRYEDTPAQTVIELNPEGTDYSVHGDFQEDDFRQNWTALKIVLEDARGKRTRHELLADWPADFPRPSPATLHRWLVRGVTLGLVQQEGTGRKAEPLRYWLAEKEAQWQLDPMYQMEQLFKENQKKVQAQMDSWNKMSVPLKLPGMGK